MQSKMLHQDGEKRVEEQVGGCFALVGDIAIRPDHQPSTHVYPARSRH